MPNNDLEQPQENMLIPGAKAGALGFTAANAIKQLTRKRYLGHGHLLSSSLASAAFGGLAGGLAGTFFKKKPQEVPMLYKRAGAVNDFVKNNPKTTILAGLLGLGLAIPAAKRLGETAVHTVGRRAKITSPYLPVVANDVGQAAGYGVGSSVLNALGETVRDAGHPWKGRMVSTLGSLADMKASYHAIHGAYSGYRGVRDGLQAPVAQDLPVIKQSGILTTMTSTLKPYIDTAANGAKLTYNTNKALANAAVTANKVYTDAKRIAAPIGRAMQTPAGKAAFRGIRSVNAGFTAGRQTYKDY